MHMLLRAHLLALGAEEQLHPSVLTIELEFAHKVLLLLSTQHMALQGGRAVVMSFVWWRAVCQQQY